MGKVHSICGRQPVTPSAITVVADVTYASGTSLQEICMSKSSPRSSSTNEKHKKKNYGHIMTSEESDHDKMPRKLLHNL
jgi:hypothetical protein